MALPYFESGREGARSCHDGGVDQRRRAMRPIHGNAKQRRAPAIGLLAGWVVLLCLVGRLARAAEPARIELIFHVAQVEGVPVAPPAFIAEQLAAANVIYQPLGIELVGREGAALPAAHAELVTRADRDALASHVRRGAIHCFVVARLMDVDEPGRERRGVHWHPRPDPRRSYLIVSKISKPFVLAHELGHLFGNPTHSVVPGNLMSYERTTQPPFLDAAQVRNVRRTLATLLKNRRLVALPAAP